MDAIQLSNLNSPLLSSLFSSPLSSLEYSFTRNFPNISKGKATLVPVNLPTGVAIYGKELLYKLGRYGHTNDLVLKTKILAKTNNDKWTHPIGLNVFKEIQLRAGGRILFTQTQESLKADLEDMDVEERQNLYRMALPHDSTTFEPKVDDIDADETFFVYTPVLGWWRDKVENALDSYNSEQLELRCIFNDEAYFGMLGTTDPQLSDAVCIQHYFLYDQEYEARMVEANYKSNTKFSMLCYTNITERFDSPSSTTSNVIRARASEPAFRTTIMLIDKATDNYTPLKKIYTVAFSFAGKEVFPTTEVPLLNYENYRYAGDVNMVHVQFAQTTSQVSSDGAFYLQPTLTRPITLHWGLEPWARGKYNSGALSYGVNNNPSFTITHESVPTTDSLFVLIHKCFQILTLNPSSGQMSISNNY